MLLFLLASKKGLIAFFCFDVVVGGVGPAAIFSVLKKKSQAWGEMVKKKQSPKTLGLCFFSTPILPHVWDSVFFQNTKRIGLRAASLITLYSVLTVSAKNMKLSLNVSLLGTS